MPLRADVPLADEGTPLGRPAPQGRRRPRAGYDRQDYFSHQLPPPDSTSPCDRSVAAGWTRPACAENLAAGHATVKRAVDGLLGSPGHCFNIMDPTLAKLGVGVATGGRYRIYYVQHFGPSEGPNVNRTVRP